MRILSLTNILRKPDTTPTTATTSTTTTKKQPCRTALEIPEILLHILSYLDNHTIETTAFLVCRQWCLSSWHLLPRIRTLVWEDNPAVGAVKGMSSRIQGVGRLLRYCGQHNLGPTGDDDLWSALVRALKKNHARTMKWQSGKQRRSIVDQSLRQLDLIGYKNLDSLVPSIMPYLCFLTSLRLRSRVHSDIRLDLILKACPRMEHLRVGMLGFVTDLPGPWVPESDAPQQPLALALQSLVVENACFAYSSLEDLLTACHALVELRLINVMITESVNEGTATTAALTIPTVDAPYDSNRLIRRLRDLQLQLRVFHVYIYGTTVSDADLDTMISVCPTSNKWTFWTQDLSPTIYQHLQTMPNNVTTLELYWPENGTWNQGFRLHEYLCKSTHLRHLRAPKARYLIDYMDIYRRAWDHETPKDNYGISPDVWQCRDLITLHLGFESLRDGLSGTPVKYYRILFGYISRVCPRLRDFKSDIIVGNSFGLRQSIDLSSGFCLLANLKDLRQLDIGGRESHVEECELSWMRRTGSNRKDQEARRKIVESWGDMTKLEADGHGVNWNYQAMGSMRGIITRVNDADLINGLNYNGCLLDVERMVKKIDSEGFQCWPQLQRSPILYFKK